MNAITYKSQLVAGGVGFLVVESYDEIKQAMERATLTMREADRDGDDGLTMPAPIELMVRTESGPSRALIPVTAIAYVIEVPESEQVGV